MAAGSLACRARLPQKRAVWTALDGAREGNGAMTDFERLRIGMVDGQIRTADVTDHRILTAFLTTPRENFVPESRRSLAYLDVRTPLGQGRATFEPMTLSRLVQLSAPAERERVLVVGCGLGYTVALFAGLVAKVVGLEVDTGLRAEAASRLAGYGNAEIVEGELPEGAPQAGPFDLIFCDGAVTTGLEHLATQLAPGGRIVAAAGDGRSTKATVFRKGGDGLAAATYFDAYGPALPGFERAPAFAF